jgi:hypothetical protein
MEKLERWRMSSVLQHVCRGEEMGERKSVICKEHTLGWGKRREVLKCGLSTMNTVSLHIRA